MRSIDTVVDALYGNILDFKSRKGQNQVVKNVVRYIMRERFHFTYAIIGEHEYRIFGEHTCHTTIMNSVNRTTSLLKDYSYAFVLRELTKQLDEIGA
jgi:hypothetical protein